MSEELEANIRTWCEAGYSLSIKIQEEVWTLTARLQNEWKFHDYRVHGEASTVTLVRAEGHTLSEALAKLNWLKEVPNLYGNGKKEKDG